MANNTLIIKNFLEKCNEFEDCKLLFIDKKIGELLDLVANTEEIYELVSECLESFNREKEFDKAFITDSNGRHFFLPPKEEFKIIALDFCILADIASGKKSVDAIISKYFSESSGKKDHRQFIEKIIYTFRDLIADAFGVSSYAVNFIANSEHLTDEQEKIEAFQEITELPIERVSERLYEGCDLKEAFEKVRNIAKNILELLQEERRNEMVNDAELICHSIIIACLDENFDTLNGLALGLKYVGKNIKSIRFYTKELVALVNEQIDWDI